MKDYALIYDNMVNGLANYIKQNGINAMVLGISGGLDSTIVASIGNDVYKKIGVPLYGISMPCSTNKDDENDAANLTGKMCNYYKVMNIESIYQSLAGALNPFLNTEFNAKETAISNGNIKARLRMMISYDLAGKLGGIVLDTDNATEFYTGFWTHHGDEGDFNPTGQLWKHEMYELAKWLITQKPEFEDAFRHAIEITPTDGNGVSKSDLDQIAPGLNYNNVDEILETWLNIPSSDRGLVLADKATYTAYNELRAKYGKELVDGVAKRNLRTEYKRKHLPLVVNVENGSILNNH